MPGVEYTLFTYWRNKQGASLLGLWGYQPVSLLQPIQLPVELPVLPRSLPTISGGQERDCPAPSQQEGGYVHIHQNPQAILTLKIYCIL